MSVDIRFVSYVLNERLFIEINYYDVDFAELCVCVGVYYYVTVVHSVLRAFS